MKNNSLNSLVFVAGFALLGLTANAQEKTLNLYSARHYQTDEALYSNFSQKTGIKINRIEGKEDELLERIRNEGANSPADILITVDAARLAKADSLGLFAPVQSKTLEARIPAQLRSANWFAFSTRARLNHDIRASHNAFALLIEELQFNFSQPPSARQQTKAIQLKAHLETHRKITTLICTQLMKATGVA